jgi:uncharacterized protein (DUF2249 family)/hemerythrin-like domain-containing protein
MTLRRSGIIMSNVTDVMRRHHAELLSRLSEQVQRLVEQRPDANPGALADLLTHELLPHAAGEERCLYPAVDPVIKAHGSATATMRVDHEFITSYVEVIDELARAAATAAPERRQEIMERLARFGLQLEAIFRLHLRKEEDVYLPLFEQYVSLEEQQRVLDGMHEVQPEGVPAAAEVLDVRRIAPPQRHGLIFQTFEALPPGGAFLLVNDHDPKPLYYQFKYEREGEFTWDYEATGPKEWRVRIGKTPASTANGHGARSAATIPVERRQ